MGSPQSLTLIDAFHVPYSYKNFVVDLFNNKNAWPEGVEYFCSQKNDLILTIRVYVDLDYKNSPKDYLRGYIDYLHELQRKLSTEFTSYRMTHQPIEVPLQYNI